MTIIAIDGTAAAGKSTIANKLATKLGYYSLNTGLIYRGLCHLLHNKTLSPQTINQTIKTIIDENLQLKIPASELPDTIINKRIITNKIIRQHTTSAIRRICINKRVVVEGRDIGSRIFPNASYKFFITAHIKIRTARRMNIKPNYSSNERVVDKTFHTNYTKLMKQLIKRDKMDFENMSIQPESIIIDTTFMTENQCIDTIITNMNKLFDINQFANI